MNYCADDMGRCSDNFFIIPLHLIKYGIPIPVYHDIKLEITLKQDPEIKKELIIFKYDVFDNKKNIDINNHYYINNNNNIAHTFYTSIYHKLDDHNDNYHDFKKFILQHVLTLPVNTLMIDTLEKHEIIELEINSIYKLKLKLTYKLGSICVYKFDNFINFSRINNVILLWPYGFIRSINAMHLQKIRYMSGMAGLLYSN